jgi:predicted TIM-barrel fold metal-dependent hydrolase
VSRAVIDVHAHVGHTLATNIGQTYAEYLRTMNALNIRRAIISVAAGGRQAEGIHDTRRENDLIAEAMRTYPDRFPVGLAGLEPRHQEKAVEELDRAVSRLELQGMVFHATFSGFFVGTGNVLDPIFDLANDFGALCLMHSTPDAMAAPEAISKLAARYRRVTIIMGHPLFTADQRDGAIAAVKAHDNLYLDLSYQQDPSNAELTVQALGAERVLFGSDAPYYDPAATIRSIEGARISDEAKERILYRNGAELIERFHGRLRR